jgi:hypothetical protein
MMKNLVTIILLKSLMIGGEMCKVGDEVEVTSKEAKELIARGVATDEADVEVTEDETMKPIEDMTKAELIAYADEIGVDVNDGMKKDEIIEAINGDEE